MRVEKGSQDNRKKHLPKTHIGGSDGLLLFASFGSEHSDGEPGKSAVGWHNYRRPSESLTSWMLLSRFESPSP